MNNLILVTGTPRSGIEMIAGMINTCGGYFGDVNIGRPGRHGSFENRTINETLIWPMLQGLNADWRGHGKVPDIELCKSVAPTVEARWRKTIIDHLPDISNHQNGFVVSQTACLIWPIWQNAFPNIKWIVVRRSKELIVESCLKTGFMKERKTRDEWGELVDLYMQRFLEIKQVAPVWHIWPGKMIAGKLSSIKTMIETIGLNWNLRTVEDFAKPILWKNSVFEIDEGGDCAEN